VVPLKQDVLGLWCSETKLPLAVRCYRCDVCALVIDRDTNAAANLAAWGEQQQVDRASGTKLLVPGPGTATRAARQLSLLSMPVEGATSRPVRRRELSLKQEPAGRAPAWRKHWTVLDRDSYETLEVPAISHIS